MVPASSPESRPAACPDAGSLYNFAFGRLPAATLETIAEHVDNCTICGNALGGLDQQSDPLLVVVRKSAETGDSSDADSQRVVHLVAALFEKISDPAVTNGDPVEVEPPVNLELSRIGCYQLLSLLGKGGMGSVYKARHDHLDKVVAIKLLTPSRLGDPQAIARFQREMRAIGKLEHPNIVSARDADGTQSSPFLVMDYVDGVDLSQLAQDTGPMPAREACELIRQAACALQHVHEHGLVHRDIKPSNLMLSRSGQVKLLDLGLTLLAFNSATSEPTTGCMTLGTLDYMAPEQANDSHQVDIRADLYGLGCTLYRLLVGHAPFAAPAYDTAAKKLFAHAAAPVPRLRDVRPDIPVQLDSIVQRLLAKEPSQRYQTPADVIEALAPFAAGYDFSRLDSPSDPLGQPARTSHARSSRKGVIATVGVVLFAAAMVLLTSQNVNPPPQLESRANPVVAAAAQTVSPRRKTAEWILNIGGSLTLFGADTQFEVDRPESLPRGPFGVYRVLLHCNEQIRDEDLARLMNLGNLQILNLSNTAVSDAGLASLQGLTTLTAVDLAMTRVGDASLGYLAGNTSLRTLRLTLTGVTDAGLAHISNLKHLVDLELGGTLVTDAGLAHLRGFTELVDLYLHDTLITDAGLAHLQKLTRLRRLWVSGPLISDQGIAQLAELPGLTTLGIRGTRCTDAGLERLQALHHLERLGIAGTKISEAGIQRFQRARPNCQVDRNSKP